MAESAIECLLGHGNIVDSVRLRGESEAEEAMGVVELSDRELLTNSRHDVGLMRLVKFQW